MPPTDTGLVVANPLDGTVIDDLKAEPSDLLAMVALELKAREKREKAMREAVEAELLERMQGEDRRRVVVGEYELQVESGRKREWDADDLEAVLWDLSDRQVIEKREWTGLISRTPKVDGKMALRLLGSVTGEPLRELEACFRWKDGTPRLSITPAQPLIEEPKE